MRSCRTYIGILEEVATNPDRYIEEEHYGNIYASALLTHFREVRANLAKQSKRKNRR